MSRITGRPRGRTKMTVTGKITWCLILVAVFVLPGGELVAEDAAPPDLARTQVRLQQLLQDELFLDTVVAVDDEHVLIIYTPQVESEDELLPELTMAVYAAGIAAPWTKEIGVIIQTAGLPLGHVIVPTQAVKNLDEGRIKQDAFYLQWVIMPYTAPDATAADMLLQDWELPAGWTIQGQQEDTPEAVLAKVGVTITEEIPIEEWLAAWSELDTPDGSLIVAALLTVSDLDVTEVLESLGAAPDPDQPTVHPTVTLTGPPGVRISGRSNVLLAVTGPSAPAQQAMDLLKQLTLAEKPFEGLLAQGIAAPPAAGAVTPPGEAALTPPAGGTTAPPPTPTGGTPSTTPPPTSGTPSTTPPPTSGTPSTTPPPTVFPGGGETQPPPMPLAANSVVKEAVLCQGVDEDNKPEGITNTFPADTVKIGLYLRMTNAPGNTEITLEWSRGERLLQRRLLLVSGSRRLITYIYAARAAHLRAGSYAVEIKEDDRLVARLPFVIQPE